MRTYLFISIWLYSGLLYSQTLIGNNGFLFEVTDTGINTKFSEIGSSFFRNKLILVSSKKIGGLAKIDPNTNEAYKELYCLDTLAGGLLGEPLLFSRILNTPDSEDQLSFSPDEKTVYYTRSAKENSIEFKLYKAILEENSHGNWINEELLDINQKNISIETPYVNSLGNKLYFSANFPDSIGGYDIYVSNINADGSLSTPKNLGPTINTDKDEKYPSLSIDNDYLFFASKGHQNIGGSDIFISKIFNTRYSVPKNLGNTINTQYDEIAYFHATDNTGYFSSNRKENIGFDIYYFTLDHIKQTIEGQIVDIETKTIQPSTIVVLKDKNQIEIDRLITGEDGTYSFDVIPMESYTISIEKNNFQDASFPFLANKSTETTYKKDLEITATKPIIAEVNDELRIIVENIHFDTAKHNIREESHIPLNKIIKVLKEHPKIKLAINAHTDNTGTRASNLNLSNKRAKSTLKYLIKNGIAKNRLLSKGYGENRPLIDCKNNCSDDDLQANRRVDFVILNTLPENTLNTDNQTGNYHIIAGSFSIKKNCIKMIEQLKKEGFASAREIGANKNGLYLAAYASYKSKPEALKALKTIRIINNEKAWLTFKKLD